MVFLTRLKIHPATNHPQLKVDTLLDACKYPKELQQCCGWMVFLDRDLVNFSASAVPLQDHFRFTEYSNSWCLASPRNLLKEDLTGATVQDEALCKSFVTEHCKWA